MNNYSAIYNFLSLVIISLTLLIIYPMGFDVFETISQYGVHYIFFLLLIAMMLLIMDLRRLMFTCLACAGLLCVFLKRHSNTDLQLPVINQAPSISVAHINLANVSCSVPELLKIVEQYDSDIISFQEFTPFWSYPLNAALSEKYPNQNQLVRIDPYGIAIYAQPDIVANDTILIDEIPSLKSTISLGNFDLNVISAYITPSLDGLSIAKGEDQLSAIAEKLRRSVLPGIVVGEFNDVYWSNKIRNFRKEANLFNSRRNITPSSLDIPHDHIFYTASLECTSLHNINDDEGQRIGIVGHYQLRMIPGNKELNSALGFGKSEG